MVRYYLLLILCCLSVNLSFSLSYVNSDAKAQNLKGSVERVKTYDVKKLKYYHTDTVAKYRRLNKPLPQYETVEYEDQIFDKLGKEVYMKDILFTEESTLCYSEDDVIISEMQQRYNSSGELSRIYEIFYDEDGIHQSGKAVDGKGNVIFTEQYYKKVFPQGSVQLDCVHASPGGAVENTTLLLRKDLSFAYMRINKPMYNQEIEFDNQERPIRMNEMRNGETTKIVIEYDSSGRKVYQLGKDDAKVLTMEVVNDEYGNPIKETSYNPDGKVAGTKTTSYTYDSHGNWIKRESLRSGESDPQIMTREIKYY